MTKSLPNDPTIRLRICIRFSERARADLLPIAKWMRFKWFAKVFPLLERR